MTSSRPSYKAVWSSLTYCLVKSVECSFPLSFSGPFLCGSAEWGSGSGILSSLPICPGPGSREQVRAPLRLLHLWLQSSPRVLISVPAFGLIPCSINLGINSNNATCRRFRMSPMKVPFIGHLCIGSRFYTPLTQASSEPVACWPPGFALEGVF